MTDAERAFILSLAERIFLAHEVLANLAEKRTMKPAKKKKRNAQDVPLSYYQSLKRRVEDLEAREKQNRPLIDKMRRLLTIAK